MHEEGCHHFVGVEDFVCPMIILLADFTALRLLVAVEVVDARDPVLVAVLSKLVHHPEGPDVVPHVGR